MRGKLTGDKKIQMWYELKWELRVAQREASVWKTWRRRDSHGEAKKRQRPVSDRQCGPPTQRVSGHPWGVRAKEGQTWPLSSCRRLAQSGTRNQSWVCLWVHVWTAQDPSWYWFYCSVLLKRTYKTQNIFKNCPTSHRLTIDGGCCKGSQQGKCALLLLFFFPLRVADNIMLTSKLQSRGVEAKLLLSNKTNERNPTSPYQRQLPSPHFTNIHVLGDEFRQCPRVQRAPSYGKIQQSSRLQTAILSV